MKMFICNVATGLTEKKHPFAVGKFVVLFFSFMFIYKSPDTRSRIIIGLITEHFVRLTFKINENSLTKPKKNIFKFSSVYCIADQNSNLLLFQNTLKILMNASFINWRHWLHQMLCFANFKVYQLTCKLKHKFHWLCIVSK